MRWCEAPGIQIGDRRAERSQVERVLGRLRRRVLVHLPFSEGYYMFIETSRPRELGDRARLVSPLYNASAKFYCVSFFYHMYGKHIGESKDPGTCPSECCCWEGAVVHRKLGTGLPKAWASQLGQITGSVIVESVSRIWARGRSREPACLKF